MIIIAGSVHVRPEARERAIAAALAMAEATRKEEGCRAYRFSVDLADPTLFYIHEEWDDAIALGRHFATPQMETFRAELPALVGGTSSITRFEVSASEPMP
jgi:quinol monooxygenase YgiN